MGTSISGAPSRPRRALNGRIRLGMIFLVIASLWRWFVHPGPHLSSNVTDGVAGVLYGISIGCLLTGLRSNALRGVGLGRGPEAGAK
jgi:hypothetical protein